MRSDVSELMMGMLSGIGRDDFGRQHDARHSLLLDTVMNGRQRASHSRLLQMPAEILADVVDFLADDKPALASLALVNSDCQQLARCCQFSDICFDYSDRGRDLLFALGGEGPVTLPRRPGIGNCVRRVTFASHPGHVANLHRELYESIYSDSADSYSTKQRDRLRKQANKFYVNLRKTSILAITTVMPNLEVLIWKDPYELNTDFFRAVSQTPVQHVKLKRVLIHDVLSMDLSITPKVWPLRSLDLDISSKHLAFIDIDKPASDMHSQGARKSDLISPMSTFFARLLQLCAPSLESLNWTFSPFSGKTVSLGSNPISFSRLQHLRLCSISLDAPGLSSFLSSPLRHLELSPPTLTKCGSTLATCGPLRDLCSFVVPTLPRDKEPCMHVAEFILQHKHIEKLYVHEVDRAHDETAHLDRCIIPVLANNSFQNLRSLSLAWGGGSTEEITKPHKSRIPETALATIGTIVSLEQLSLSSGISYPGWQHQWLVDHTKLRHHLQDLSRLKRLALVRDTYPILEAWGPDPEQYYYLRLVTAEVHAQAKARMELDMDDGAAQTTGTLQTDEHDSVHDNDRDSDEDDEIWERAHRNRMLTHAEEYAVALPALEWMFCGQRPIGLERDPRNPTAPRKAVPLTKCRDGCYTFLNKTFGLATDDG